MYNHAKLHLSQFWNIPFKLSFFVFYSNFCVVSPIDVYFNSWGYDHPNIIFSNFGHFFNHFIILLSRFQIPICMVMPFWSNNAFPDNILCYLPANYFWIWIVYLNILSTPNDVLYRLEYLESTRRLVSYCYLLDSMKCVSMCGHILYRNLYLFEVCFSLLNWTVRSIHTEPVAEDSMGLPRIFLNNELRELSAYSLRVC